MRLRLGFNAFNINRSLSGPDAKFVSPNNDTLYNMAALDLSGGPLLLHAPDTAGRRPTAPALNGPVTAVSK